MKKVQRSNFATMSSQSRPEFDTRLRIKLQEQEEPQRKETYEINESGTACPAQALKQDLASKYERLTK